LSSLVFLVVPRPPSSTLLPYTTLFRSVPARDEATHGQVGGNTPCPSGEERADNRKFGPTRSLVYLYWQRFACPPYSARQHGLVRSEEHTSELQSRENLVCRLLLEKKKN